MATYIVLTRESTRDASELETYSYIITSTAAQAADKKQPFKN